MKLKKFFIKFFAVTLLLVTLFVAFNVITVLNSECKGTSISHGKHGNGRLENGCRMPYSGSNFYYFNFISYFILKNGYVNSRLREVALEAYRTCETSCPGVTFGLMESGDEDGGRQIFHKTHQNGLSIDFMTPLRKDGKSYHADHFFNRGGYGLDFDNNGMSTNGSGAVVDYESMARHIIALDDACKKNGMGIRLVIFKLELKPHLFATASGKILKKRGIHFAQRLSDYLNRQHDDHYHIDFTINR